jgi:hypothetical protein
MKQKFKSVILEKKEYYLQCHKEIIIKLYIRLFILVLLMVLLFLFKSIILFFITLLFMVTQYGFIVESYFYASNPYLKYLANKL